MAEAILALKRSPDLRAAMAARGRAFALENFSRERVLKAFEEILSSMP
jgi:glycosyltransferase involved in cell wall biosynthesis